MKKKLILAAVALASCVLLPQLASANGGGYRFGVKFTGGVAPFEPEGVEQVQISDIELFAHLDAKPKLGRSR